MHRACLDSQSVRSSAHGGEMGYVARKKTKGHKRFLLVDTNGWVLGAKIELASRTERAGALALLPPLLEWFHKLKNFGPTEVTRARISPTGSPHSGLT